MFGGGTAKIQKLKIYKGILSANFSEGQQKVEAPRTLQFKIK